MNDRSLAKVLALAGIVGPIVFAITVILQSLLQPDYADLVLPISALAAWPLGWVQNLNFFVLGTLMAAYALALHRTISPTRFGAGGPLLIGVGAAGLLLAGAVPWERRATDFIVPPGHLAAAVLAFGGSALGLVVVSARMRRDPFWRARAAYALASGVAMLLLFVAIGAFARPDDAPLHDWAGLMQRVTLAVWFPCTMLLAARAWQRASQTAAR